jgi:hypothetical protein
VSAGEEIAIRENSKKLTVLELAKEFASHGTTQLAGSRSRPLQRQSSVVRPSAKIFSCR